MNLLSPFCEYQIHDMCRGKAKTDDGGCRCWCHHNPKDDT